MSSASSESNEFIITEENVLSRFREESIERVDELKQIEKCLQNALKECKGEMKMIEIILNQIPKEKVTKPKKGDVSVEISDDIIIN